MEEEKIIISLGGSLIVPDEVDADFLKDFRSLILSQVGKGKKFILITGGGKICRKYDAAAKAVANVSDDELDWLGIYATRFNAEFVRILFGEQADKNIITDPKLPIDFTKPIVIGGGWKPGNSTDLVAVLMAESTGAKKIINLSNTSYVYDSDPKTNPNARKIEQISWADFRKLIPSEWHPGLNSPFDPVASERAERHGITVVTMNGKLIDNVANYLEGKPFTGTTIS